MRKLLALLITVFILSKCEKSVRHEPSALTGILKVGDSSESNPIQVYDRKEVPILCYHNLSRYKNTDITLSYERFESHIKFLADSGYHTIVPDQLVDYYISGRLLPPKPVMISFDDTRLTQFTIAATVLEHYGFKGVFFIMTVCVNKPNYMSSIMINDLANRGHIIAAHTYDHPRLDKIGNVEWQKQLKEPKIYLENIIHNPVTYFAYPYGMWTENCIQQLKRDGYKAAFQLTGQQSKLEPLFSIRRLLVSGYWPADTLQKKMAFWFNR